MKNLLIILLTLFCVTCFSQAPCSEDSLKTLNKELKKVRKQKSPKNYRGIADKQFQIGLCSLSETDTLYKTWFIQAINNYKKSYAKSKLNLVTKVQTIYRIGLCHYYLKEFDKSIIWIGKSISADHPNPLTYYYRGKALKAIGKYEDEYLISIVL